VADFLTRIRDSKKEELVSLKYNLPLREIKARLHDVEECRDFRDALCRAEPVALIGEIKKRSPSKGILKEDLNIGEFVKIYERSGASAISILTERFFFSGNTEYIGIAKEHTTLPILRKDFLIDEYHIYESRLTGADAILLIVALLEEPMLKDFIALASELGMASLVEVHDEWELEKALKAEADIIGINNRDLRTFQVDINTTFRVIKEVPEDKIVVSESGINTGEDVKKLIDAGVRAILVGEALVTAKDPEEKIRELLGRED